jgi:predicted aldo/keto reductase-like oxidoreductase
MIYRDLCGIRTSMLGFGAMRLPTVDGKGASPIDYARTEQIIDRAIEGGVNYFDTAYPYHGGQSEIVLGKILSKYPRESYLLATKFPGHQICESYDPREVFEHQLKKCGVEYFDFYLLHDVNETSVDTYLDKRWGIIDYFLEQKRAGRIRRLGFSSHARLGALKEFLDGAGGAMDFCQIQLNYIDYTLQQAKEKLELLESRGIPAIIMEPVRGGKLARLEGEVKERVLAIAEGGSCASVAFRFLQGFDGVRVVLSGMSDMAQVEDNLSTFDSLNPLDPSSVEELLAVAETMKGGVPCTGCRYCVDGCPMGIDIPMLMGTYNEMSVSRSSNAARRVEFLEEGRRPVDCISCGACSAVCPQKIDIPTALKSLDRMCGEIPSWRSICLQREEESRRMKEKNATV